MFKIRVPESLSNPDRTAAFDAAKKAIAAAIESKLRKHGTAVFEILTEPLPRATAGIEVRCVDEGVRDTGIAAEAVIDAVKAVHAVLGGRFSVRGCTLGCEDPILALKGTSAAA